jgi:hypothetical protein
MKHAKRRAEPKPEPYKHLITPSSLLSDADRAAYQRAIEITRQHSPARAKQIDDKLQYQGFEAAGEFAVHYCQCDSLRLRPWEAPPCAVRGDADNLDPACYGYRPKEVALRDRLLAAGLSVHEPDPIDALARVEHG